jgi:uncharacterized protein (TIGR02246 family)
MNIDVYIDFFMRINTLVRRTDHLRDEATIRGLGEAYDIAWNRGDVQALISCFTLDAIVINPRGEVTTGKAEFEKVIIQLFRGPFKDSMHKTKIIRIHFPKMDVAVVDGEAILTVLKPFEGSSELIHRYTDVMVKEGDRWLISDTRAYGLMES